MNHYQSTKIFKCFSSTIYVQLVFFIFTCIIIAAVCDYIDLRIMWFLVGMFTPVLFMTLLRSKLMIPFAVIGISMMTLGSVSQMSDTIMSKDFVFIKKTEGLKVVHIAATSKNRKVESAEVMALALNMYHEARGEGKKGALAVAEVTMTRVKSEHFPDTVRGVVYQNSQFSWTDKKKKPTKKILESSKFMELYRLAHLVLDGTIDSNFTKGADHFHKKGVRQSYANHGNLTRIIKNHEFYKVYDS